jgi:hypothetical protein
VPGTTPSVVSVIPSPPQATWKDRVNPFRRHGSGSALTVIDTASTVASGVIGVPLCSCQPGSNAVSPILPYNSFLCCRGTVNLLNITYLIKR